MAAGSQDALATLYDRHAEAVYVAACRLTSDRQVAEEVVQETFLAALKGGKSFAGRSAEKTWLVGIMKNKISDHYRKASRESHVMEWQADSLYSRLSDALWCTGSSFRDHKADADLLQRDG